MVSIWGLCPPQHLGNGELWSELLQPLLCPPVKLSQPASPCVPTYGLSFSQLDFS